MYNKAPGDGDTVVADYERIFTCFGPVYKKAPRAGGMRRYDEFGQQEPAVLVLRAALHYRRATFREVAPAMFYAL